MSAPFAYDRSFELPRSPEDLWETLARTHAYPTWWPWLRSVDGDELAPGVVAHCVVRAPAPLAYTLRFDVRVEDVTPARSVRATVSGDLEGPARLELAPSAAGCTARLVWSLDLRDRLLGGVSRVARPAMVWAHDRVIASGLRSFTRQALDG